MIIMWFLSSVVFVVCFPISAPKYVVQNKYLFSIIILSLFVKNLGQGGKFRHDDNHPGSSLTSLKSLPAWGVLAVTCLTTSIVTEVFW